MKVEVKKIDTVKREITVEVSGDVVKNKFEDVFGRVAKEAKVPGFRPGHAPRDIVEKQYAAYVHEQVIKELVPDIYNEAVNKEGLDVIELPEISAVKLERSSLFFKASVEVGPEITVKNYKGLKVKYAKPEASPEDIKRSLDSLKESRKIDSLDDNFARGLCYPGLARLEEALKRQIITDKENRQRQDIEAQVIEEITNNLDFKLPQSLINRQAQDMLKRAKVDLVLKGVDRPEIDKHEEKLTAQILPEAKKQVKVYLVLSQIAKKENIAIDDHMPRKVMELILCEAKWEES